MALPYPTMDFVPFDILTAEELDQIVANIESLSNGSGLGNNTITFTKLLATIFSGQVQSQVNAGSAGGTMKYINLGGIKLLWAIGAAQNSSASAPQYNFTLPVGFFTTITYESATATEMTASATQYANIAAISTTTATVSCVATSGSGTTQKPSILLIGT